MGEIEGTYRVLQTPGTRLGTRTPVGVSTLEPGQTFSAATGTPARMQEKHHIRVELLDNGVEVFDVEVRGTFRCFLEVEHYVPSATC